MANISIFSNLNYIKESNKNLAKKFNMSNKNPHEILHLLSMLKELEKEGKIKVRVISSQLIQN